MEGIHAIKDLLRQGTGYNWPEGCLLHNPLPFGFCWASWVFTLWSQLWLYFISGESSYIDDILLITESKDQARDHAQAMVHLLEFLGFIINTEKPVLTTDQTIEFLGLTVDSINMELWPSHAKIKQIRAESWQIMRMIMYACTHARICAYLCW